MKNILHIVDLSKTGGVEVMFMHFIEEAIKWKGYSHHVFALRISEDRRKRLKNLNVKTYCSDKNGYNLLFRLKIPFLIWKKKINIIYGQNFSGNFWGAIGKLFSINNPIFISHEHGGSWGARGILKLFSIFWVIQSDKIICNSNAASIIINKRIFQTNKTVTVYNGVKLNDGKRHIVKQNDDKFRVLFVGRLVEVKGIDVIIHTAKKVINSNKDVYFIFVGDGDKRGYLENYVKINKLDDNVEIKGVIRNVADEMGKSDVLILPSIREPLGNVIIEAGLKKLPVIASRVDGIPEIVKEGKNGLLIEPVEMIKNPNNLPDYVVNNHGNLIRPRAVNTIELTKKIQFLIKNKTIAQNMGVVGYQMAKQYTIGRYAESIQNSICGLYQ